MKHKRIILTGISISLLILAVYQTFFTQLLCFTMIFVSTLFCLVSTYIVSRWMLENRRRRHKFRKKKHLKLITTFTQHDTAKLNHRLQTEPSSIGDDGEIVLYDENKEEQQKTSQ